MAKANKKAIESSNFWDTRWIHDRLTSGKPEVDADETKLRHQKKKDRLRKEKKLRNWCKYILDYPHKKGLTKIQKAHDQIQYGVDLANWWNEQHA